MSLVKKLKDILFEEEEYTEPIKVKEEKKEEVKIVEEEKKVEEKPIEIASTSREVTSERELLSSSTFEFPEFDEEEFKSSLRRGNNVNVLDYERSREVPRKETYYKEKREVKEERINRDNKDDKKKFRPSPIISPVYGILNQDYKAEDIVKKEDIASNIDIDTVRKKAFENNTPKIVKEEVKEIDEPVVTFFEEKDNDIKNDNYKSIDDLLEEASTEIPLEDTLEIPTTNNLEAIEEELEKVEEENKTKPKEEVQVSFDDDPLDDTLDNDLFELIDSMYDERGEE